MADRWDDRSGERRDDPADGFDDAFDDAFDDMDDDMGEDDGYDTGTALGTSAYLASRTRLEEAVVRAAFDDLRAQVRAEVKAPPVRVLEIRSRRRRVRAARRRVAFAAAAAAVVGGGALLVVQQRPGGDAAPSVVASRPAPARTTAAVPEPSTATPTTDASATPSTPAATTRTVVVTVPQPTRTKTRQPSASASRTTTSAPATAGPRTEVTVYLWQGTLYPTCLNQYAVKRTVDGTGGWAAAVSAALAGTTASEKAAGYVSPFGPDVRVNVDESTHSVNFSSTSGFDGVPPACRSSLESLVTRTAADAGHGADMELRGSTLLWTNWRIGLL